MRGISLPIYFIFFCENLSIIIFYTFCLIYLIFFDFLLRSSHTCLSIYILIHLSFIWTVFEMEHFIVFCIFYSKADRISSQSNKKGSWILKRAFIA